MLERQRKASLLPTFVVLELHRYNELQPASLTDDDFLKDVKCVLVKMHKFVFILSLFNLYGSMISGLKAFLWAITRFLFAFNKGWIYIKSVN